jgi:hypothetical protein
MPARPASGALWHVGGAHMLMVIVAAPHDVHQRMPLTHAREAHLARAAHASDPSMRPHKQASAAHTRQASDACHAHHAIAAQRHAERRPYPNMGSQVGSGSGAPWHAGGAHETSKRKGPKHAPPLARAHAQARARQTRGKQILRARTREQPKGFSSTVLKLGGSAAQRVSEFSQLFSQVGRVSCAVCFLIAWFPE